MTFKNNGGLAFRVTVTLDINGAGNVVVGNPRFTRPWFITKITVTGDSPASIAVSVNGHQIDQTDFADNDESITRVPVPPNGKVTLTWSNGTSKSIMHCLIEGSSV